MKLWSYVDRVAMISAALYSAAGLLFMYGPIIADHWGRIVLALLWILVAACALAGFWREKLGLRPVEAALGGVIGILGASFFWWNIGAAQLRGTLREVRGARYSMDYPGWGPLPADHDAEPLYRALSELFPAATRVRESAVLSSFLTASANGEPTAAQIAETRALLEKRRAALLLIDEAAALRDPVWLVRYDHDPPWDSPVPQFFGIRLAAQAAAARAVLLAREGRVNEAATSLRAAAATAHCAGKMPSLIGTLADRLMLKDLDAALPAVLARANPDSVDKALRPLLGEEERRTAFRSSVQRELLASPVWFYRHVNWWNFTFGRYSKVREGPLKLAPVLWAFMPFDLDADIRGRFGLVQALDRPYSEAHKSYDKVFKTADARRLALFRDPLPNWLAIYAEATTQLAYAALAKEMLDARLYRAKHGRWPTEADEKDPFTGEPLKLAPQKDGLVIYSVGPDLKDDSGAAYDEVKRAGDIAVRL